MGAVKSTGNYVFVIAGLAMIIWGISNKKKWRKEPKWRDLSPDEKRIKIILVSFIALVLLAGIVAYLLSK